MEVKSLDSPDKLPHILDNPAMLWKFCFTETCSSFWEVGRGGSGFMFVFWAEGFWVLAVQAPGPCARLSDFTL